MLDLSRSVINGELSHNRLPVLQAYKPRADLVFGRLQVWREPNLAWIAATAKRSIVALDCATRSLPLTIPCTRVDMAQAQPKCGICWLAWSKSGMFLASRNGGCLTQTLTSVRRVLLTRPLYPFLQKTCRMQYSCMPCRPSQQTGTTKHLARTSQRCSSSPRQSAPSPGIRKTPARSPSPAAARRSTRGRWPWPRTARASSRRPRACRSRAVSIREVGAMLHTGSGHDAHA